MKTCSKCKVSKVENEFYKRTKDSHLLSSWCKECSSVASREYNRTHQNEYRVRNKEQLNKMQRKYYRKNKKKLTAKVRKYRKEYRKTKSYRYNFYKANAKTREISFNLTFEEFENFWEKPCSYCGGAIPLIGLDRIDSTKGYKVSNIATCCTKCNRMKSNLEVEDFLSHVKKITKHLQ